MRTIKKVSDDFGLRVQYGVAADDVIEQFEIRARLRGQYQNVLDPFNPVALISRRSFGSFRRRISSRGDMPQYDESDDQRDGEYPVQINGKVQRPLLLQ